MKTSQLFFKTHKETPSDCDIVSHQLMERAGLIKRLSRGIYSFTPLMWRIMKKIMAIIREEMDLAGAQEVLLPQLQPASIWEESGRLERYRAEKIIYELEDREEGKYCLGPTHEEVITLLVKNWLTSYKQLPVNLYQIANKFRDEIRPRFGLMRAKEFMMKDAYAFCATAKQMDEQYMTIRSAYCRIFERLGLNYVAVEADGGAIGKGRSEEFQVLAEVGEDSILACEGHAANIEALVVKTPAYPLNEPQKEAQIVETIGTDTIEKLCQAIGVKNFEILKTILYRALYSDREEFIAVAIRGDRDVNEVKLKNLLNCLEIELANHEDLMRIVGVKPGFLSPHKLPIRTLGDLSIESMKNFVVAINKNDFHQIGANWKRDLEIPELHDLLLAKEGDLHPVSGKLYKAHRGIEVGHIFNLGEKYSEAFGAVFSDAQGKSRPLFMGCYGIGVGRLAAAIIEQRHDAKGIIWPLAIAPFKCMVTAAKPSDAAQTEAAANIYHQLKAACIEVLFDDRDERLGFKLKDSDLIGIPYKMIVGSSYQESQHIEIEPRVGESFKLTIDDLPQWATKNLT